MVTKEQLIKMFPHITKNDLDEIVSKSRDSKSALGEMRKALSLIENPGFGPEFKYAEIKNSK